MADDIITRLRQHLTRRDMTPSTHWDGCIESHPLCALAWALDEIEALRALCDQLAQAIAEVLEALEAEEARRG